MDFVSILLAALGIGFLIIIHEAGHFLAARLAGVRVEVFSIGFGPRLFGRVWNGTDFRVSLVPFGGYVMVAGQDPTDRRYPAKQSLWSKSVPQRALFWSGGVLMNTAFALIVFPLVFRAGVSFDAPVVGTVLRGGPAWEAGIEEGERVVSVDGKAQYSFDNMIVEIALSGGRPVHLELSDGESTRVVTTTPRFDAAQGLYGIGIQIALDAKAQPITVEVGGPADKAGLRTGDLLQAIDGKPAHKGGWEPKPGEPITVAVQRDGEAVEATLVPGATTEGVPPRIGVAGLARRIEGIRPGSALVERLGLQRGDIVLALDGTPFTSGELEPLPDAPARTRWLVRRGEEVLTLEQPATAEERRQLDEHVALAPDSDSLLVQPEPDSAAAAAGMQSGDRIVRVNGKAIESWKDLVRNVEAAGDHAAQFEVRRLASGAPEDALNGASGDNVTLTIAPRRKAVADLGMDAPLALMQQRVEAKSFGDALRLGWVCSLDLVKQLYVTLKRIVTGEVAAKNLGGIIRISQVSYRAAQRGPSWFWYFMALLSMNLAFVNLLPVPVLDGGHLLFLLIEKIKGSPVSTRVLGYSQIVGLVFVLLLLLFVTYNDILRLL
jgi:regulator of sigma E protease